jgi:hypothetical protein
MANLVKHPGLDLPVFDVSREEVVDCLDVSLGLATIPEEDQFIRYVSLSEVSASHVSVDSLKKLLEIADNCFQDAARYIGGEVIKHTWGLVHDPFEGLLFNSAEYMRSDLVPAGHILGAEVSRITPDLPISQDQKDYILAGRRRYRREATGITWNDFRPEQFIQGLAPEEEESKLWLVDIDPVLRNFEDRRLLNTILDLKDERRRE